MINDHRQVKLATINNKMFITERSALVWMIMLDEFKEKDIIGYIQMNMLILFFSFLFRICEKLLINIQIFALAK